MDQRNTTNEGANMETVPYRAFGMSRMAYNLTRCAFWFHEAYDIEWDRLTREYAMIIIAGNY